MSQVGGVADANQGQVEKLTELALSCIEESAANGSAGMQGNIRRAKLQWAMQSATVQARKIDADRSDTALAAAAALALIENAGITGSADDTGRIFKQSPDSTPVKGGTTFSRHGLLVLAAGRLAEKVGLDESKSGHSKVQGLAAGEHLRLLLQTSVDNLEAGQPADQWWDSSLPAIAEMLKHYAKPHSAYPTLNAYTEPECKRTGPTAVGVAKAPEPPDHATNTSGTLPAEPSRWTKFYARVAGTRPRVATSVAVVTILACIGLAEACAPIPRLLFGWQDTYVDSYPIPSLPPPVDGVDSALTLPNTSVRLFFMDQGSEQAAADQTVNGRLPVAAAAVMPLQYQIATFQVLLSKTHKDDASAADTNLKLWIQAPLPMDITGATLMKTPVEESIPQPDLDTVNGNGGTAVDVPSLDDGDVLYQFQVVARPDRSNNGYFCGYNAKFVQVMVRSGDKTATSQDGVVTPYPLYVPRGEGC